MEFKESLPKTGTRVSSSLQRDRSIEELAVIMPATGFSVWSSDIVNSDPDTFCFKISCGCYVCGISLTNTILFQDSFRLLSMDDGRLLPKQMNYWFPYSYVYAGEILIATSEDSSQHLCQSFGRTSSAQ
jgi:hypothetical protein